MTKQWISDARSRNTAKAKAVRADLLDNLIATNLRRTPTKIQRHHAASDKFRKTGE